MVAELVAMVSLKNKKGHFRKRACVTSRNRAQSGRQAWTKETRPTRDLPLVHYSHFGLALSTPLSGLYSCTEWSTFINLMENSVVMPFLRLGTPRGHSIIILRLKLKRLQKQNNFPCAACQVHHKITFLRPFHLLSCPTHLINRVLLFWEQCMKTSQCGIQISLAWYFSV